MLRHGAQEEETKVMPSSGTLPRKSQAARSALADLAEDTLQVTGHELRVYHKLLAVRRATEQFPRRSTPDGLLRVPVARKAAHGRNPASDAPAVQVMTESICRTGMRGSLRGKAEGWIAGGRLL